MDKATVKNKYGTFSATIPKEVTAGGEIGWHIRFELAAPVAAGGGIRILFPAYTHQRSSEYVQNTNYWQPHFLYAYFEEEDARLITRVEKIKTDFSHILRWKDSDRIAVIEAEEEWPAGAVLHIVYGGIDRMWLKGYAAPTRAPHHAALASGNFLNYEFSLDGSGKGEYQKLDILPPVKVVPEQAYYLTITAPTCVRPGKEYLIRYTVSDRFRNPLPASSLTPVFTLRNLKTGEERPLPENCFVLSEEGFYEIDCQNRELHIEKAALACKKEASPVFWGDTHCHTVLTPNIRDNNNGACPQDAYQYARETACLDFVALIEQTFLFDENERLNITSSLWETIRQFSNQNYQPGQFVTFPGVELHSRRGDTVVVLAEDMAGFEYPAGAEDIYDIWRLYRGKKYLSIPHFHRYCGGRPQKDQQEQQHSGFDLKNWEPSDEAEALCEFYSAQWGRFEYPHNPMLLKAMSNIAENDVVSFLNRGKRWGITAGSDDHDSMPGHGGLTAVYADELTREGLYNGLKARHTYATTHTRIYLNYRLNDTPMGECLPVDILGKENTDFVLHAEIAAPERIHSLSLIVNGEVYQKLAVGQAYWQANLKLPAAVFGAGSYLYLRVKLEDESIILGSPIWV